MKISDRGYWISKQFLYHSIYRYIVNSVRFKSPVFFSLCNPGIDLSGFLSDKKTDIYQMLPQRYVPRTAVIRSVKDMDDFMDHEGISFPVILKPNVGLKGHKVYKIDNQMELDGFFETNDLSGREWLVQEYVDFDREFSILIYKYPKSMRVGVSSFIEKKYPSVVGDGTSTLRMLIDRYPNSFLDREVVLKKHKAFLDTIPPKGAVIVLDYVGNYSRGALFLSLQHRINDKIESFMAEVFKDVNGLNFFRMDFKADSIEGFLDGEFKILEINGLKSEPLHIYDKNYSFFENRKIIIEHWHIIEDIIREQQELGVPIRTNFFNGVKSYFRVKKAIKT